MFTIKDGIITFNYGKYLQSLFIFVVVFFTSFVAGVVVGFLISKRGYVAKVFEKIKNFAKSFYSNLKNNNVEEVILVIAVVLVFLSIIFECFGYKSGFPNAVINVFGTLIVSWLVTKKSSQSDMTKKEQENAKKSRRYLNSIKTTATNAFKIIDSYISDSSSNINENELNILKRATDQINHIIIGIETSINDWEDLMSENDIESAHAEENIDKETLETMKGLVPNFNAEQINIDTNLNQNEA